MSGENVDPETASSERFSAFKKMCSDELLLCIVSGRLTGLAGLDFDWPEDHARDIKITLTDGEKQTWLEIPFEYVTIDSLPRMWNTSLIVMKLLLTEIEKQ